MVEVTRREKTEEEKKVIEETRNAKANGWVTKKNGRYCKTLQARRWF